MRESLAVLVVRLLIGSALLALMGMLLWSTTLIEQEMKGLRQEVHQLQGELVTLQLRNPTVAKRVRPHLDPSLPNLLDEDPFYATTLPALLGADFRPQGTLRAAEIGRPQDFHPFSAWASARAVYQLCTGCVATSQFGTYEELAPDLATKLEERKGEQGPEFWIHLREGISWAPLNLAHFPPDMELAPQFQQSHPVTAHDFKFHFDAVMNPYVQEPLAAAMRNYLSDIEEFRVIDDLTFVVRWKTGVVTTPGGRSTLRPKYLARKLTATLIPLPCWVYQCFNDGSKIIDEEGIDPYRHNSIWAQNFSQHWAKNIVVSCGPWLFDGLTDREIRLKRNPRYHNPRAALAERRVIAFKTSPDAMWQDFKAGKVDTFDSTLAPQKLLELEEFLASDTYATQGAAIKRLDYLDRSYRYAGWNQARPLFESKSVRQALTMAIDRERLIDQCLGAMGEPTTGPLFPGGELYDSTVSPWPFDPLAARRLLAEEGWIDHDGDGIIDKEIDGQSVPFRFKLTYYVHSQHGRLLAETIATSLKEVGIECRPHGVDVADLAAAFEGKDFDAILMAWALGAPPPEPKQLWHSSGATERGSSNAIGFSNPEVDTIIETLQYAYDPDERMTLYHRFHQIIHDEAPYTFLYVPKAALLYRDYVQNVFIPKDVIPGASVTQPIDSIFWLKQNG